MTEPSGEASQPNRLVRALLDIRGGLSKAWRWVWYDKYEPRWRGWGRTALYNNRVVKFIRHPFFGAVGTPASGLYFTLRGFLGEQHPYIANYDLAHTLAMPACAVLVLLPPFFITLHRSYSSKHQGTLVNMLQQLSWTYEQVVDAKLDRFKEAAHGIDNPDTVFETITQPDEQIKILLREVQSYLNKVYRIASPGNMRITIVEQRDVNNEGDWNYIHDTRSNWQQTNEALDPTIVVQRTLMYRCSANGEPKFLPNKFEAAKLGEYYLSERDKRRGNGSIFCYPIRVVAGTEELRYVVNITTYNEHHLGPTFAGDQVDKTAYSLAELCKRFELELTLRALKRWQQNAAKE